MLGSFLLATMSVCRSDVDELVPAAEGDATQGAKPAVEAPAAPIDVATLMSLRVKTASKFEQPLSRVPSSVSIVTEEDIKRFGYRTLADLLRGVRDLHVTSDRVYSFLGVRGYNPGDFNSRMLLLVNGHRINQNLSDAAPLGTDFPLDIDLVKQVEIIRGPGSVLYGNNAFFGVINVITRDGADLPKEVGIETSVSYGSFDTWQGRATFGRELFDKRVKVLLSGTYLESHGEDAIYYPYYAAQGQNGGVVEDGDAVRAYSAFGSLSFSDFTLEAGYGDRAKQNPTGQHGTTFNDNRHELTDRRFYTDLRFERELVTDLTLLTRAYYDRYEFKGVFPFPDVGGTLEQDKRLGQWYGLETQLTRKLAEHHTLSVGGEFRHDFDQERTYSQIEPTYVVLGQPTHRTRLSYSGFVNGEFKLFPERWPERLTLDAGVRYDGYDQFDNAINPRAALIYQPWKTSTFKAVYGSAFRTPNFFELFDPFNQDISPEKITTYELIYEQGITRNIRTSVSGFYNQIDDVIAFDFQPAASRYRNFKGAETLGFSVELEAFGTEGWTTGVRGRIGYTFQNTEDLETHARPIDSPRHLVKVNLSVPMWEDRITAGAEVQYTSERTSVAPGPTGTLAPGADAQGFAVVNLTLLVRKLPVKGLELSASIYNLFNEHYADPATPFHLQDLIPQPARTFRVKMTYRF